METWRLRKEIDKLNDVEQSFYNTMCRHPKHINCNDIGLKRGQRRGRYSFGYVPYYGLYCKNHDVFIEWIKEDLTDSNSLSQWYKLGIERID
jgi:hypothetical protein